MTRSELIARLALRHLELNPKDVEVAVCTVLSTIKIALAQGNRVEVRGFGTFTLIRRQPRIGRNPKTGERVAVRAKRVPFFKPAREFRERVNHLHSRSGCPQSP